MTPARNNQKRRVKKKAPEHPSGDERYSAVDRAAKVSGGGSDSLLEVLSAAQQAFGYLSEDRLIYVSNLLGVPLSRVYGVATFYHLFTFEPQGEHNCIVCTGTACHVKGSGDIVKEIAAEFKAPVGGTTEDGELSLTTARCLGSCGLAPVVVVDGDVMGKQQADTLIQRIRETLASDKVTA
jgi:bidirectional [NiFe] hydrogenase diaphorase subunit